MMKLHSAPGEDPIEIEGLFDAPPERVFEAWIEPDQLMKWFGPAENLLAAAEIDLRVGGQWRFHLNTSGEASERFEGEYLAIEPGERLVFSWSHVAVAPDGTREATPTSKVSITFEPVGAKTRMHLRHEAIQSENARRNVSHGWSESLDRLTRYMAEREGVQS